MGIDLAPLTHYPIIGPLILKNFNITVLKVSLLANDNEWTTDHALEDLEENARVLRFASMKPRFLSIPTGEERDTGVEVKPLSELEKGGDGAKLVTVEKLTPAQKERLAKAGLSALSDKELKARYGRPPFFRLDGAKACIICQIDNDNYCFLSPVIDEQALRFMPKVSQADMMIAESQMNKRAKEHADEKSFFDKYGAMLIVAIFCIAMYLGWVWIGVSGADKAADKAVERNLKYCKETGACKMLFVWNGSTYYGTYPPNNETLKSAPPDFNPMNSLMNWVQNGGG
jgi:hypothetical protein